MSTRTVVAAIIPPCASCAHGISVGSISSVSSPRTESYATRPSGTCVSATGVYSSVSASARPNPVIATTPASPASAVSASATTAVLLRLLMLDEGAIVELGDGLLQLGLRVHDDRAVPRHGFFERLARHQQESDALIAGLHGDLVTAIEQYERAVAGLL